MATRIAKTIATVVFSSIAVLPITVASLALTTGSAWAKSQNSGSSGKSSGSQGSSASSNSSGESRGNPNEFKIKNQHGRNVGGLRNLNAVHPLKNGQGYQNASTNSNVGQIATLKEVVSRTTLAKNHLENAKNEFATYLEENPDLTKEEIDALIAKTDPESESYEPDYVPTEQEAKTLEMVEKTKAAQTNYDEMTASFDEALMAASGGRVLSDGALQYFKSKLGF